eukprot:UN31689
MPYNRWFLKHHVIMVPSVDKCQDCDCDNYEVVSSLSNLDVEAVIVSGQEPNAGELKLMKKENHHEDVGIPAVYVSFETQQDIKRALQKNSTLTLHVGKDGDVGFQDNKESQSLDWLSLTTIEEWLFLLFLCLLLILFILLGIKLYKAVKKRWRSSSYVRRDRLRQLSRIPTIQ